MHPTAINARTGRATVMFWIEDGRKKNTGVALKPRKENDWGSTIHEIDDTKLYERPNDEFSSHEANRLRIGRIDRVSRG